MYQSMLQSEEMDNLFRSVLTLKTTDECYMFFEDLCTISELKSIAQRLKVASLLRRRHTCQDISQSTGASTATISRVNKCLNYGTGGYKMVLNRLEPGRDNGSEKS